MLTEKTSVNNKMKADCQYVEAGYYTVCVLLYIIILNNVYTMSVLYNALIAISPNKWFVCYFVHFCYFIIIILCFIIILIIVIAYLFIVRFPM